jgi:DNA-binding transcriptional ArsR family regulator
MNGVGEDSDELLAAIECAANPTRHRILEMLIDTPGLGAKALADKMGFTRQHISYHISELRKVGLIKDMPAGTTVIFHVTQLGRTTLQRIHAVPPSEAHPTEVAPIVAPPPSPPSKRMPSPVRAGLPRLLGLVPALVGLGLLTYAAFRAFLDGQPSYIVGGLFVFIVLAILSRGTRRWWS